MEAASEKRSKLWTRDFISVGIARFFSGTTLQVLLTVYPIFLNARGFSATAIGAVATMYTASSMVMRFVSGRLVDSRGRRGVGLLGAGLVGAGILGALLVTIFESSLSGSVKMPGGSVLTAGMIIIIFCRMLHGLGNSTINISSTTMFADVLPKDRFVEGIGYSGLFNSVAQAIGPAIGIALIGISAKLTFAALLVPIVICFILVSTLRYESNPDYIKRTTEEDKNAGSEEEFRGFWKYFEKRSIPASVIMFIIAVCAAANTNFLAIYARSIGLAGVSAYFTFKAACMILTRIASSRFSERIGVYNTILLGLAVISVGYFGIPFARTPFMLYFFAVFDGLGCGLCYPMLSVLTLNGVPRKRRGIANSTYLICWDMGSGAGAMLWGALIDGTGSYRIIFLVSGAVILVNFLITLWFRKRFPSLL